MKSSVLFDRTDGLSRVISQQRMTHLPDREVAYVYGALQLPETPSRPPSVVE